MFWDHQGLVGGDFKVYEDEAVNTIALAYYGRDVLAFRREWDPSWVLQIATKGNLGGSWTLFDRRCSGSIDQRATCCALLTFCPASNTLGRVPRWTVISNALLRKGCRQLSSRQKLGFGLKTGRDDCQQVRHGPVPTPRLRAQPLEQDANLQV